MAEFLGLGLSHYPPLSMKDEDMAGLLRNVILADPSIPDRERDPANWPELMRLEWGDDEGRNAAAGHRAALVDGFERCRAALDEFQPDVVIIWGDDQYENFREDLVPPYTVLAYPDLELQPWAQAQESSAMRGRPNYWDEPEDFTVTLKGSREVGKKLASGLLERGIDVSYAYSPLHHDGLSHAFLNAVLYLDYHRKGFPYPVLAFPINTYGRKVISYRGFFSHLDDIRELDPPSPQPYRLMDLGAATVDALAETDLRVALVASSSWSHAFLTDHTFRLRPDTPADRRLYDYLVAGEYGPWRELTTPQIEEAGQQELLAWLPVLGAMDHIGRSLSWSTFTESDVFNSNKVFAIFD